MKKIIFGLLIVMSSVTFAGGYNFDCSNSDNSITISDRGDSVKVYGKSFSSVIKLDNLEIWVPLDNAKTEVISSGKRIILHKETDNSCRDTGTLNFAQKLTIRDNKTKEVIATDYFICNNSYATTTGGRDCSNNGHD